MPSAEKRVEVLEDELKLLKGEVKRTLVDLRAFVMREDSPLNERITLPPPTPETQTVTQVSSNGGGGGDSGRVEALEDELRAMRKEAASAASGASNASGDKAMDVLSQGLKSQQGDIALELLSEELKSQRKERSEVAVSAPTPAPVAPAAPTVEANVSATPAAQASPAPAAQPAATVVQPATPAAPAEAPIPQPQATSEQVVVQSERDTTAEQSTTEHEIPVSQGPRGRRERSNGHQRPYGEDYLPEGPRVRRKRPLRGERGTPPDTLVIEEESPSQRGTRRRIRREDSEGLPPDFVERRRYNGMNETQRPYEYTNGSKEEDYDYDDEEESEYEPYSRSNGYRDKDMSADSDSLDVNLISNLVRWSFHAKRRLGQEGLMEMVELYLRAGHHSRDLREIIAYICSMADEDTSIFEPDPAQDCVDLIHQLHGILAGGIPISHRLRMRFAELERTDRVERLFARGA